MQLFSWFPPPGVTVTVLLCIFILLFGGLMDYSDLFLRTLLASGFSIEVKVEKINLVFCFRCNSAFL